MSTASRTYSVLLLVVVAAAANGCGPSARFRVTHPALLNAAPYGNTYQVAGVRDGSGSGAGAAIQRELELRVVNSLNPSIRLQRGGGGLIIGGEVVEQFYDERSEYQDRTCTRRVAVGRDARGNTTYQTQQYACRYHTRYGTLRSRVRLGVSDAHGTVIFDRVYQRAANPTSTSQENRTAPAIDYSRLLHTANMAIVEEFARVILPWAEEVNVRFTGCGGHPDCDAALRLVRAGDLEGAVGVYDAMLGEYGTPGAVIPPELGDRVAEQLYTAASWRSYLARFTLALSDLQRACELKPGEGDWRRRFEEIQGLAQEYEALQSQGAVGVQRQAVEQAGAP